MARTKTPRHIPAMPIGAINIRKRSDKPGYKATMKTAPGRWSSIPCTEAILNRYGPKDWREVVRAERIARVKGTGLRGLKIINKNKYMPKKSNPSRESVYTHKNPDKIAVKPDKTDWRYVQVAKGKWALRAPEKITA